VGYDFDSDSTFNELKEFIQETNLLMPTDRKYTFENFSGLPPHRVEATQAKIML
jgi:hypothetical protein